MDSVEKTLECDLVMKGGVTSGLVYPPAVFELSKKYRFRNIGGTSAGAVAAALTAAAEYRRAKDGSDSGFQQLDKVAKQLQEPGYLRNLFQGSSETEPLLNLVLQAPEHQKSLEELLRTRKNKGVRIASDVARWLSRACVQTGARATRRSTRLGLIAGWLLALTAGVTLYGISALLGRPSYVLLISVVFVAGLVLSALGAQIASVISALHTLYEIAFVKVPSNLFGICTGLHDPKNDNRYKQVAATEWLVQSVEEISNAPASGSGKCLTFADLKAQRIGLQFVSTNVSDGRPYVVPFDEPLIFKPSDFHKLFPAHVVAHFENNARQESGVRLPRANGAYLFLPHPDDWPVAAAARLSMSFPLFFSSVPLYRLPHDLHEAVKRRRERAVKDPQAGQSPLTSDAQLMQSASLADFARLTNEEFEVDEAHLIPHWFSDGGIASNFPIHFFDGWLPERPTFGITLRYIAAEVVAQKEDTLQKKLAREAYLASLGERALATLSSVQEKRADGDVWLPLPQDTVPAEYEAIHHPNHPPDPSATWNFLWAIIKTMQNYRDNMQAALPSYRERVVQIRLRPDEGGFNLAMPPDVVKALATKGIRAATLVHKVFNLPYHQWVRLRMLVSRLEDAFEGLHGADAQARARTLIKSQANSSNGFPYSFSDADLCNHFEQRTHALLQLPNTSWKGRCDSFESESTLRVTPHP